MKIRQRPFILFIALFMLLPAIRISAGEQVMPPVPRPATVQDDAPLPTIRTNSNRADRPDICPVCGKTRTECNKIGIKYHKLIKQGRYAEAKALHVCPVQTDLGKVKSRPVFCPICRHKTNVPLLSSRQKHMDMDADRCPHPTGGQIKFFADIVICPRCGFSAYHEHFVKPQTPATRAWVKTELAPHIRKIERHLIGAKLKRIRMSDNAIVDIFDQETMPDTVRCENALAFYIRIKAHPTWLVKLALQCAWAYRRQVCAPLFGAYQAQSVRRIMKSMERAELKSMDLQKRISTLAGMYQEKSRFTYLDRQVIRLILAGYYDRMGLTGWARTCLKRINRTATTRVNTGSDPWLQGIEGTMAKRQATAEKLRAEIAALAKIRLGYLEREMEYLNLASNLIRKGMANNAWNKVPQSIPAYIYYAGECERRMEHFTRARIWLNTAKKTIIASSAGMELFAPKQLDIMRDYMRKLGMKSFPADPRARADLRLVSQAARTIQLARAAHAKSVPPMTMRGDEAPGDSARHRNDMRRK